MNSFKNENVKSILKIVGIFILGIIGTVVVYLLYSKVWYPFYFEAKYQQEFNKEQSAGDCRILNSKYAYENNMGIEVHSLILKVTPNNENGFKEYIKVYHVYAVDKNNKIYDVSNNSKELGLSYDEYIKVKNIVYDEKLLSAKLNKNDFSFHIEKFCVQETIASLIALPIYYITYKLNR